MIVVVGAIGAEERDGEVAPAGVPARVALAAAGAGRRVEVVTRLGDDPMGDAVLLALTRAGVGHVATLRDAAHATPVLAGAGGDALEADADADPETAAPIGNATGAAGAPTPALDAGDVGLALRYLPEVGVVVLVHPADVAVIAEATAGARFASAALVILLEPGQAALDVPGDAVVLEVGPEAETVAEAVGRFAAALDDGAEPGAAFEGTLGVLRGPAG